MKTTFTRTALAILVSLSITACGSGSSGGSAKPAEPKKETKQEETKTDKTKTDKTKTDKTKTDKTKTDKTKTDKTKTDKTKTDKTKKETKPIKGDFSFMGSDKKIQDAIKPQLEKEIFNADNKSFDNQDALKNFSVNGTKYGAYYNNLKYSHIASVAPANKIGGSYEANDILVYVGEKTTKAQMPKKGTATYLGHALLASKSGSRLKQSVVYPRPEVKFSVDFTKSDKPITGEMKQYTYKMDSADPKKSTWVEAGKATFKGTFNDEGGFAGEATMNKLYGKDKDIQGNFEGHFMGDKAQELAGSAKFEDKYRMVFNADKDAKKADFKMTGGKPK